MQNVIETLILERAAAINKLVSHKCNVQSCGKVWKCIACDSIVAHLCPGLQKQIRPSTSLYHCTRNHPSFW